MLLQTDHDQTFLSLLTSLNIILDSTMIKGVRILNRKSANSGSKVFVSCVMIGSDKSLSSFQKRFIFSSLTGLRMLKSINMRGRDRKVIIISCMDYEAAAEDCGTQVIYNKKFQKMHFKKILLIFYILD